MLLEPGHVVVHQQGRAGGRREEPGAGVAELLRREPGLFDGLLDRVDGVETVGGQAAQLLQTQPDLARMFPVLRVGGLRAEAGHRGGEFHRDTGVGEGLVETYPVMLPAEGLLDFSRLAAEAGDPSNTGDNYGTHRDRDKHEAAEEVSTAQAGDGWDPPDL